MEFVVHFFNIVPDVLEYPDVPVQLKNNRITGPLNMVTEMYALPAYNNVDPNPLMAPFFILFYGIMMADMGYGLLMFIAGMVITKKYRPKGMSGNLFNLMSLCGITTFIMGAITGGFFGDFLTMNVVHSASTRAWMAGDVQTVTTIPEPEEEEPEYLAVVMPTT